MPNPPSSLPGTNDELQPAGQVLVLLHGHGDDATLFAALGRQLAADQTWTIICPPAPHLLPDGGRAWWAPHEDAPTDSTLRTILELIPMRTGGVCITGFSQGGAVALRAAQRFTEAVHQAACTVAVVAAFLPGDAVSLPAGTEVLVVHGMHDEVVDPFHGELLARRLRRQDCMVTEVHHDGGHVWDATVTNAVAAWLRR